MIDNQFLINGGQYRATAGYIGTFIDENGNKVYAPGTCALIGPRLAITCGHCVYDYGAKRFISSAIVNPGVNDGKIPDGTNGIVNVIEVRYDLDFVIDGYAWDDWALLILDRDISSEYGYFGVGLTSGSNNFLGYDITVNGYPNDKNENGPENQWTSSGTIIGFTNGYYLHDADTLSGNSGSPMIALCDGELKVIGVHAHGKGERRGWTTFNYNGGPCIDQNLLDVILKYRNGSNV